MTSCGLETWHPNPRPFYQELGGPVYDLAGYYLSALVFLMGPIKQISAFGTKGQSVRKIYVGNKRGEDIHPEIETHVTGHLLLESGAIVNLTMSFDIYKSSLPCFEIYGEFGTLSYPDPNFGGGNPRIYRKEQFIEGLYQSGPETTSRKDHFFTLPEVFPRYKDYARGVGVLELAHSIQAERSS